MSAEFLSLHAMTGPLCRFCRSAVLTPNIQVCFPKYIMGPGVLQQLTGSLSLECLNQQRCFRKGQRPKILQAASPLCHCCMCRSPEECPEEIAVLIRDCLSPEPEARPDSTDIFHILQQQAVLAPALSTPEATPRDGADTSVHLRCAASSSHPCNMPLSYGRWVLGFKRSSASTLASGSTNHLSQQQSCTAVCKVNLAWL